MKPFKVTVTGVNVSPPEPLDIARNPFTVSFGCVVTGTATYSVQHSFDNPYAVGYVAANAKWFDHPAVAAATGDEDGTYAFPVRAIRLNITSGSGSVTMNVIQAGSGPGG